MEEEVEEEVEQAVPSLLEKLRSPTSSTLARKRKITKNKPPTGCKRKGSCSSRTAVDYPRIATSRVSRRLLVRF